MTSRAAQIELGTASPISSRHLEVPVVIHTAGTSGPSRQEGRVVLGRENDYGSVTATAWLEDQLVLEMKLDPLFIENDYGVIAAELAAATKPRLIEVLGGGPLNLTALALHHTLSGRCEYI